MVLDVRAHPVNLVKLMVLVESDPFRLPIQK
jgi:hypothetical protein